MGAEPVTAGGGVLLGDDFDRLAATQGLVEGDDAAIDTGAPAAVTDLGMDGVGEIQGRGAPGHLDDLGAGRQHIDVGWLELGLEPFEEIAVILALAQKLQPVAHPHHAALEGGISALALLVGPVGGNAQLGVTMHIPGADLHLQRLILRPHHRRVQGLVHVALGGGDVIVELLGDMLPETVDHP